MLINKPNFKPDQIVVSCHIICNDEIFFLLRNKDKPQGNTYGIPAGKVCKGEDPMKAIIREIWEETGIVTKDQDLEFQKTYNVSYDDYDFEFHLYHLYLSKKPEIHINKAEHMEYVWRTPLDAIKLPLVEGHDYVLRDMFNLV